MSVLVAENLTKTYGEYNGENATKALAGVSLSIEEGEFVAIMGPSGSGKSTLVNILSGITAATSGKVLIANKQMELLSKDEMARFRRRNIGFVFQEFNLLEHLTLEENVMLPMVLDHRKPEEIRVKVNDVLEFLGIAEIGKKYPANVSGGQQQRAAVARALMNEPDIIFADEPTGNLDSKSANAVMRCLGRLNEEKHATIMMVTHDVFAASFCKRVIFIKDGSVNMEIRRKGTRKEFFDQILDCQAIVGGENLDL